MTMANLSHITHCGLRGIDQVPFGMHICQFYSNRDQLVSALVPYVIAGLRGKERCLWVTALPLPTREALRELRAAWDGTDDAVQAGALRILDFEHWYGSEAGLRGLDVVELWLEEEKRALAEGHSGLRIAGNTSFLQPRDWSMFMKYEQEMTARLSGRRIVALCSYPHGACNEQQMNEVMHAHHCTLERPDDDWQMIHSPDLGLTRRKSTKRVFGTTQQDLRMLLDSAAEGLCSIDREGTITLCNSSFLSMTGFRRSEEVIGKDFYQLINHSRADNSHYPRPDCPVLKAAQTGTHAHAIDELFYRADGTSFPVEYWARPIVAESGIVGAVCTFVDISERKQAETQQQLLNHELAHRGRNTLTVVQAIVSQTFRNSEDPKHAVQAINARLFALSYANEVLMRTQWHNAPITDVVKSGIAVHGSDNRRIQVDGPKINVGPRTALALTMALHELCTNAIKYGALSNDGGNVVLDWSVSESPSSAKFQLRWRERGGPAVTAPTRTGFGSRIIDEYCGSQLGGNASLLFNPDGVEWTLDAPMSSMAK
jgi:PAS domain S-box-containing protein